MKLTQFGNPQIIKTLQEQLQVQGLELGRIIAEHKGRYRVQMAEQEGDAEIPGRLRYHSENRKDYPAVGDWVSLQPSAGVSMIQEVLPRTSVLCRSGVGNKPEEQVIAANIDYAMILLSADRDFNLNRLDRYLSICYSSQIQPVVVITKTDLMEAPELEIRRRQMESRAPHIPLYCISNTQMSGYEEWKDFWEAQKTYCLLGSSGVGKSSMLNNLLGEERMKTRSISMNTSKGRHTTTHREVFVLANGAILIDNPGMREVGMAEAHQGIETTFGSISEVAEHCRFKDCSHVQEKGCAVLQAVTDGSIPPEVYSSFQKLRKESEFFEQSVAERRRKERIFSKMQRKLSR